MKTHRVVGMVVQVKTAVTQRRRGPTALVTGDAWNTHTRTQSHISIFQRYNPAPYPNPNPNPPH